MIDLLYNPLHLGDHLWFYPITFPKAGDQLREVCILIVVEVEKTLFLVRSSMSLLLIQLRSIATSGRRIFLGLLYLPLLLLLASPAYATGVYQIPDLTPGDRSWILDQGEVLSRANEAQISNQLDQLEKDTGTQIRFVTIHRLDYGETIESFTDQLFQKWFPTAEDQAHQVLLVLDTLTNTSAIRTGAQVKETLSDEIAQSVSAETLQVPLRESNKYNQAFGDASNRLVAVLSGQPDPGAPQVVDTTNVASTYKSAEETEEIRGGATGWVIGLLAAATIIPMLTYYFYVR